MLVHMHIESEKDNLVQSRQKKGRQKWPYHVLWSEFHRKPVQFLQEWCHMIVFGLSKNKFCSVVLDSASRVILQGWNCSSQAWMLWQMKRVGQLHSESSMVRLKLFF